jgi:ABC-type polar amino acid transport system ATPase subunit
MLTAKNIKKKYGLVEVLKGVDLAINNSEIVLHCRIVGCRQKHIAAYSRNIGYT